MVHKGKKKSYTTQKTIITFKDDMQEYAQIIKPLGHRRLLVLLPDHSELIAHIPGRFKRKTWINTGDIVLISRRDFQEDKVDIIHKYNQCEIKFLMKEKEIPKTFTGIVGSEISSDDVIFEEEEPENNIIDIENV